MKPSEAVLSVLLALGILAAPEPSDGQQPTKVYRVGVVLEGGPYYHAIDGLRDGLKELGFEEGTQYLLDIRDVQGDLKAVGRRRGRWSKTTST